MFLPALLTREAINDSTLRKRQMNNTSKHVILNIISLFAEINVIGESPMSFVSMEYKVICKDFTELVRAIQGRKSLQVELPLTTRDRFMGTRQNFVSVKISKSPGAGR